MIDRDDIKNMIDRFSNLEQKQLPYAQILATNDLAFATQNREKVETLANLAFKRNIPNTIRVTKATKSISFAEIFLNQKSWTYYALKQHYLGGDRHSKGLENYLKSKHLLESNEFLIPMNGIKRTASKIIMQELKNKNLNFYVIPSRISYSNSGIYQRNNQKHNRTIMLFKIVRKAKYKKVLDLEKTLKKEFQKNGIRYFKNRLEYAIKTAK
ncbi:hypothetical protein ACOTWV_08850 [Aliarcobacter butzleri]